MGYRVCSMKCQLESRLTDISNHWRTKIRDRNTPLSRAFVLSILLTGAVYLSACASHTPPFSASIEPNPGWRIGVDCGYEVCKTVWALFTKDLVIRFEPVENKDEDLFYIKLTFVSYDPTGLGYDPSTTYLTLNEVKVRPKVVECEAAIHFIGHYKEALRQAGGLTSIQALKFKATTCFTLFIDTVPPSKEETFKLDTGQIIQQGNVIVVPQVSFSANVREPRLRLPFLSSLPP